MANSKRKCGFCGKRSKPESGFIRGLQFFCGKDHYIEYAGANVKKLAGEHRVKQAKESNKAKVKAKSNDRPKQFDLTKKQIQKWVNHVRDAGLPCISCSTTNPVVYCGSHYRSAGGNPEIALDTRNIHRACNRYCNKALSGNISGNKTTHGYTEGLLMRYGQDYIDWIKGPHESPRYNCEQLREIRAFYAKLIREGNKDDSNAPHK